MSRWLFALRMWLAINLALGVAFWVQLTGSDAGVIVALLAMQTRGQAFEKGVCLFIGTAVGGAMAVVIVGLFAQARDLYIVAYAGWLGVCVFGAGFFDGNRAYGAVVCGYTVSIVAVIPLDKPYDVFSEAINRCAAIAIGIVSVLIVVDVFRGAEIGPSLIARIGRGSARVRAFTDGLLRDGPTPGTDARVAEALQTVSVQHPLLNAVPVEAVSGTARAGAVRAALAALAGEVGAARALTMAERGRSGPDTRGLHDLIVRRLRGEFDARRAAAAEALAMARDGRPLSRPPRMPIYRPWQGAVLNGLRAFVASVLAGYLFVWLGWPQTSFTWAMTGVIMCFAANAPDPGAMTKGALIAIPSAVVLGGITEFLILDGADAFPLLMLGTAPALLGSLLLTSSPKPALSAIGLLLGVFTIVSISPSNPQSYDPQSYVVTALLLPLAALIAFVLVRVLFPTTDAQRRRWALAAARRDMLAALRGRGRGRPEDETWLLDASRVGTLSGLKTIETSDLTAALRMADLARAARRISGALDILGREPGLPHTLRDHVVRARAALAAADAGGLRCAARGLLAPEDSDQLRLAADLAWAADLIDPPTEPGWTDARPTRWGPALRGAVA